MKVAFGEFVLRCLCCDVCVAMCLLTQNDVCRWKQVEEMDGRMFCVEMFALSFHFVPL